MQRQCVFMLTVLAIFAWVGGARAQFDDNYFDNDWYENRHERRERYQSDREILEESMNPWGSPNIHETPEYQSWERQRGLDACLGITNNAALQSRCLQGLQ